MSELKSFIVRYNGEFIRAYNETEVDKYIALLKDKANYNEYAYKHKSEELADTCRFYEDELRHHKYKRCLTMYNYCLCELEFAFRDTCIDRSTEGCVRWRKWANRWLGLAEKFKEKK